MAAVKVRALLVAFAVVLVVTSARAHELRPGVLDVTAVGSGRFEIAWAPAGDRARPVFPAHCARDGAAVSELRFFLDCGAVGLAGHTISVTGLAPLRDEVLVRVRSEDGAETSAMLNAAKPAFVVPDAAQARTSATSAGFAAFALMGAAHLLTGPDHVLFLVGLLLLVRKRAALVAAITAFTAAHSLTLALQVIGAVRLPPAPVEATIALSVLFLAREIARARHPRDESIAPPTEPSLAQRRPYVVTFAFGLLHGLGFAGGLAELRIPQAQIPAALLGFNAGLEAAQLAVVLVALGLAHLLRSPLARQPRWLARVPAYGIGAIAALWLLQRIAAFRLV